MATSVKPTDYAAFMDEVRARRSKMREHPAYDEGKFKANYFSVDAWDIDDVRCHARAGCIPSLLEAAFTVKDVVPFIPPKEAVFNRAKFHITRNTTLDDRHHFASIFSHDSAEDVAEVTLEKDAFVINMFRSEENCLPFGAREFLEAVYRAKIEVELDHLGSADEAYLNRELEEED